MRSFAILALAGAVAALPQGDAVTSAVAPQETIPAGCSTNYAGSFMISVVNVTTSAKRSIEARQDKALTMTLKNGVLVDDLGRTGYIASNNQFQFDGPAQAGAIYTAGWSVCSNNTLALGNSAIFYKCLSGTFYNLYDESTGAQCSQIYIDVIAAAGSSSSATASGAASQLADGQVTANPVTQITDGQIQATTGVVTQISDGQIQAATSTASRAVVTQISDGQIQAASSTSRAVVTQISDGQIQAPTNATTPTRAASPSVSVFTGSASSIQAGLFGVVAGVVAMAML